MKVLKSVDTKYATYHEIEVTICEGSVRNATRANSIDTHGAVSRVMSLFDGVKVIAHAYSGTNLSFYLTEKMIDDAYAQLNKESKWFLTAEIIADLKKHFCVKNEKYNCVLACSIPNSSCVEYPRDIQNAIDAVTK